MADCCAAAFEAAVWWRSLASKVRREMDVRTEFLFSTELPFTRGSFTASVRDHNLREASHLYYEGKE